MISIRVDKKRFKGVYRWDELTLRRFADLASIPIPANYEQFISDGNFESAEKYIQAVEKITEQDTNELFPEYYRKVVGCLSDVPVNLLTNEQVTEIYERFFKPFVLSIIYHVPVIYFFGQIKEYTPSDVKYIRMGFNRYYLPETVNVMGQEIPMAKEPILTYTEASDIFRGMKITSGDIKNLALFMAIYCRKKGEPYDQRIALERQELFLDAPMSVVWSVFFCTCRRLPDYKKTIQLFGSLPKSIHETVEAVRTYRGMVQGDLSTR